MRDAYEERKTNGAKQMIGAEVVPRGRTGFGQEALHHVISRDVGVLRPHRGW